MTRLLHPEQMPRQSPNEVRPSNENRARSVGMLYEIEEDVSSTRPDENVAHVADCLRRADLLSYEQIHLIPAEKGIYVGYFGGMTGGLQTERCQRRGDWVLLHVGKAINLKQTIEEHFDDSTDASAEAICSNKKIFWRTVAPNE